jgi:hypothetical protein
MATRNVTFMKLNARKFLTEIEPDAPFFLCVRPARAAPAAVHSHHTTCQMPRALHCQSHVASGCRYVGFGDCHRCGEGSALGAFCEHFGADGYAAAESTFKLQHAAAHAA